MKYGRTAFVVGVMFTIGKHVGEGLLGATETVVKRALQSQAKNGNEYAQTMCKKMGIQVDNQNAVKDSVIGFKAD